MKNRVLKIVLYFLMNPFTQNSFASENDFFTEAELVTLSSMHVRNLESQSFYHNLKIINPLLANDPVKLIGEEIFFSKDFSLNGTIACSSCHSPQDSWVFPKESAKVRRLVANESVPLGQTVYFQFLTWNGSKDSVFAQSLAVLLNPKEHQLTESLLKDVFEKEKHRVLLYEKSKQQLNTKYCKAEGNRLCNLSVQDFVGLALEAFIANLSLGRMKLDDLIEAIETKNFDAAKNVFTEEELAGLKLFLGKGQCTRCHTGPLLSDRDFHNIGAPRANNEEDERGRFAGALELKADPNNCNRRPSAVKSSCPEIEFLPVGRYFQIGQYRTPQLRNVALTAPYFHNGQAKTLEDVISHYSKGIAFSAGDSEIFPLNLETSDRANLAAFLRTLRAPTILNKER